MIPGNDDALRAIRLFTSKIAEAVVEGRQLATEHDFIPEKDATCDEIPVEEMPEIVGVCRSEVCRAAHVGNHAG